MNPTKKTNRIAIAIGPYSGSSTHHQDQSITPPSFKPMNSNPNNVVKEILDDLTFVSLAITL